MLNLQPQSVWLLFFELEGNNGITSSRPPPHPPPHLSRCHGELGPCDIQVSSLSLSPCLSLCAFSLTPSLPTPSTPPPERRVRAAEKTSVLNPPLSLSVRPPSRETALLIDPKNSCSSSRQWVALVVGHELAHQWFGNLVTMVTCLNFAAAAAKPLIDLFFFFCLFLDGHFFSIHTKGESQIVAAFTSGGEKSFGHIWDVESLLSLQVQFMSVFRI